MVVFSLTFLTFTSLGADGLIGVGIFGRTRLGLVFDIPVYMDISSLHSDIFRSINYSITIKIKHNKTAPSKSLSPI